MLGGLRRLLGGDDLPPLERALLDVADQVWVVKERTVATHYPFFEHPTGMPEEREALEADRERCVAESFRRLLARWPERELTRLATEMLFNSQPWYDRYAWDHRRPARALYLEPARGRIIAYLLKAWLAKHPPEQIVERLRERLTWVFANPHVGPPTPYGRDNPYPPTVFDCLELLRAQPGEGATALVCDLLGGALDPTSGAEPGDGPFGPNTIQPFLNDLNRQAPWMLERVWQAGLLTDGLLEATFHRQLWLLHLATLDRPGEYAPGHQLQTGPEVGKAVEDAAVRFVRRWAENLDESNARVVSEVGRLQGSWFLIQACQHAERLKLKALPINDYGHRGNVAAAVTRLCDTERTAEEGEGVVAALRAFKESTLLLVLPPARQYQDLICRALGWDGAYELVQVIQRTANFEKTDNAYELDVRNSPDPTNGVVDAREVRRLHELLGEKRFNAVLKTFLNHQGHARNAIRLVEACLGVDADKTIADFGKRNQLAVRALGLLPITHPDEVLRRYVALRQFAKEANQFGMQRQTNERAAAAAGLSNLALNAGFPDATRLEWAMEDRLGAELGAGGREWPVDENCTVRLEIGADGPDLTAYKAGKALRTLPDAVKKHPDYERMKEAKAELRAQARRYKAALEDVMCRGEELAPGELAVLARNPSAARMLEALLLIDTQGRVGFYWAASSGLVDLAGTAIPLDGPVRLVHPVELHERGLLAVCQREVIRRRLVQPFKQAFREIYVVTPAERETRVFSRRFAGQTVGSAQAARLLQAEGWDCIGEDYPQKVYPREGVAATLTFVESYHFMSEIEALVVDEVCFLKSPGPRWWSALDDQRLPLAEIPPVVFSEVMRDVDLVVSVAQGQPAREPGGAAGGQGRGEPAPSAEVVERRADLVRELTADLGYKNVVVEGQYARVQGKLANYRVHLASATIHIEPGAYLCIVPTRWGQKHDKLFLPFDAEDLKTSEVVSKVLLLAEDDKIKDESILSQIRTRR